MERVILVHRAALPNTIIIRLRLCIRELYLYSLIEGGWDRGNNIYYIKIYM